MFKKLYKNIYLRDKTREIGTRFSETIKELSDALNVVPVNFGILSFSIKFFQV